MEIKEGLIDEVTVYIMSLPNLSLEMNNNLRNCIHNIVFIFLKFRKL